MSQEKKLTGDEAQEIGRRFLLNRYPGAKVSFNKVELTTKDATPLYCLEGDLKMPSRNLISQLLWRSDQYIFKIEVSALEGRLIGWELE